MSLIDLPGYMKVLLGILNKCKRTNSRFRTWKGPRNVEPFEQCSHSESLLAERRTRCVATPRRFANSVMP